MRCWAALALCTALVACGSSKGEGPPGLNGGAGGSGATGGSGGSGLAGSGGGAGAAGAAGCVPGTVLVSGSLDGQAIDGVLGPNKGGSSLPGPDTFYDASWWEAGGMAFRGSGNPATSEAVTGTSYLAASPGYALAGRQLFAQTTSGYYGDLGQPRSLESLLDLGSCPGTPAAGTLTLCKNDSFTGPCQDDWEISGSLDAQVVSDAFPSGGSVWVNYQGEDRLHGAIGADGLVMLVGPPGSMAGVLVFPLQSGNGGMVVCVGSGERTDESDHDTYALSQLSIAGTLPGTPIAGSLQIQVCSAN